MVPVWCLEGAGFRLRRSRSDPKRGTYRYLIPKRVVPVALTKRQCDGAEPQENEYTLWDTDPAGFGLRVWPAGRKVPVVKYRGHPGAGTSV